MEVLGKAWRCMGIARYGAFIGWEKLTGYNPKDPHQVPPSAAKIAPEWLESFMCRDTPGARITDIAVTGGSDGTNTRRALTISYNDAGIEAGLEQNLFVKSATAIRTRMMNGPSTRGESEVRFYQSYRDKLPIEAPKAIYAGFDRPSGRMLIIFPNMALKGTKFLDPSHHITRVEAEGMIDLLATYQAHLWNSPTLKPQSWLPTTLQYQHVINVHSLPFEKRGAVGLERGKSVLPAELLAVSRRRLWELHMASIRRLDRKPVTLCHYDMHIGNWYITADQNMGLTDWSMRVGHWSADLTYTLVSALRIEDRRAWERELLLRYRERLREHGVADLPSNEEVWDEYRRQTFHPLYYWLTTIGAGILQPDMQPNHISIANLERMGQAVIDLESIKCMQAVM